MPVITVVAAAAALAGAVPPAEQPSAGAAAASAGDAHRFARSLALAGPRPTGSAAERRAHARVEEAFAGAGLRIGHDRFAVPGHGRSRNVIGIRDAPGSCLKVVMAHVDTVPPSPGANDNASGAGALVALAAALPPVPACDVWLVATGAEERVYTGRSDHLGASALVRRLRRLGRAGDVRYALSVDEVGRGTSFWLRSPVAAPRAGVERALLRAAAAVGVEVRWVRDSGDGNSDHREPQLAGIAGMKLGVPAEPCRHTACDTADRLERGAFTRALRVLERVLR